MLVLIITSGYAIVRTSIPGWWIWAYWISPFAYGLRAVVINELTSPGWQGIQAGTTETVGEYSLKEFGFFTERQDLQHNAHAYMSLARLSLAQPQLNVPASNIHSHGVSCVFF